MASKRMATDERAKALRRLKACINVFQDLREHMPASAINTFLLVALNEGKTLTEYVVLSGLGMSTISRHLLDLGDINRFKEPGYQLVQSKIDPMDRRNKHYALTTKGKLLLDKLLAILDR